MSILLLIFLVTSCSGAEFDARVRTFSIELTYSTHLHFDNFALSPFCVWSIMVCVALGATGSTDQQIKQAVLLRYSDDKLIDDYNSLKESIFNNTTDGVELAYGTFIFQESNLDIRPLYMAKLSKQHGIRTVFLRDKQKAASFANSYINNDFPSITNLFHSDDFAETAMVLSNVIHFKGTWTIPFNRSSTTEEIIYNDKNIVVGSVSMMRQTAKVPYSNFESMKAHIMELSYGHDKKFSMLYILPYPGVTASYVYSQLEKVLLKDIFNKLQKEVDDFGLKEIEIQLPKLRIRTSATLNRALNDMGVLDAFEPDYARFLQISDEGIYIDSIDQKTEITFDESETVATATIPGYFNKKRPITGYKAKDPFIFFLIEKPTLTILFSGIYSKHNHVNLLSSYIIFHDD